MIANPTTRLATLFLTASAGLTGCMVTQTPPTDPTSEGPPLAKTPLVELAGRWQTFRRVEPPPPDYLSAIVLRPRNPDQDGEAFDGFERWCKANGGRVESNSQAGECPDFAAPISGCLGEATAWYQLTHRNVPAGTAACLAPDGRVTAALLRVTAPTQSGTGTDRELALYSGPELGAFLEKYVTVGREHYARDDAARAKMKEDQDAAFEKAVSQLDAQRAKELAGVPLARESVDFIRERVMEGYGRTRLSVFGESPCVFHSQSENQNPWDVDLKQLDLNALETVTDRKSPAAPGHASEDIVVYQVLLRVGSMSAYADFVHVDSARRTAKAFTALARRCGAKVDTRFR